ncbi:MAG TPA: PIN domain-containing protein [Terriglobales bacterium]|jgi:predicted nucleic acid-binding protein
MSAKFFLDTNIFVYAFDTSSPAKKRKAETLIEEALRTGAGVISYQVVQEFFNLAFRGFANPFTLADGEQYLVSVFRPLWAVHSSPALYLDAIRLRNRYQLQWYDSVIAAAALEAGCAKIYSEDFQHASEIDGVRIQNPFRA